ncbi:MAG: HlyC/CorC family transporter [Gammaproteobacteria bacterium]
MENLSLVTILSLLFGMLLLSCFFSASEASILSINRYRLKHLSKISRTARQLSKLLARPDRLLSVILIGNNFANTLASALATMLALKFGGDFAVLITSVLLTFCILIFSEISPKTVAALHPEKIAFPASYVLRFLLWCFYPLVWFTNGISIGLLKLFGIRVEPNPIEINREELRTLVHETHGRIHPRHRDWLLSILDLESVTVDDIMVPKHEIVGIDLSNDWPGICSQLSTSQHTILVIYEEEIDHIKGILHVRNALNLLANKSFTLDDLKEFIQEPYFIPQGTPVTTQLLNFQKRKSRIALVVDEYGELEGLVTLADILEEIVGEFTTDIGEVASDIHPQEDGSVLVDGSVFIRELNRSMQWDFPTDGPKTLSGLIIEYLETIPEIGTCLMINQYPIEVMQLQENRIKTVKIFPKRNV